MLPFMTQVGTQRLSGSIAWTLEGGRMKQEASRAGAARGVCSRARATLSMRSVPPVATTSPSGDTASASASARCVLPTCTVRRERKTLDVR
eukprot:2359824-Pleurochrysis_carterae.AAC.5